MKKRRRRPTGPIPTTPAGVCVQASVKIPVERLLDLRPDQRRAFMCGIGEVLVAARSQPTEVTP